MAKNSLKKSLLCKIPVQFATAYVVNQARRYEKADYYIKAAVHNINHTRILVLYVYHREDLLSGRNEPRFRTFMTKTDYITQYYEGDSFRWRTGRLEWLIECSWYGRKEVIFCDMTSEKVVNQYLAYTEDGRIKRNAFGKIRKAQSLIMEKRLDKKASKNQKAY